MKYRHLVLVAAVALTGCNETGVRAAKIVELSTTCSDYGFERGSDAHSYCMQQEARADEARWRALSITLQESANHLQRQQQLQLQRQQQLQQIHQQHLQQQQWQLERQLQLQQLQRQQQ